MTTQSKNQGDEKEKSKKDKKKPLSKLILTYLTIFIFHAFFIGALVYFISPLSKIKTITVQGNQDVYDQLVIDENLIEVGDWVYKSKGKILESEKNIKNKLTQISDSELRIEGFNQLIIEVEEFDTVAYIAEDESYLKVLENGQVLDKSYSISLGNQLILSKFKEGDTLNLMIDELEKVEKTILNLISEIELIEKESNPLFIHVYMNNGNRVLAKIPDFSEKISYYPQMVQAVEGKKGIFDMEAGIYFVPFKDEENIESGTNEEAGEEIDNLLN